MIGASKLSFLPSLLFFWFSVKPFSQHGGNFMGGEDTKASMLLQGHQGPTSGVMGPPWEGRSIATQKLRLVEFSAFVDAQRDADTYQKHLFVHIGGQPSYSDPTLEVRDIKS